MAILGVFGSVWASPLYLKVTLVIAVPILVLLAIYFIIVPNSIKVQTPSRHILDYENLSSENNRTHDAAISLQDPKVSPLSDPSSISQTTMPYATQSMHGARSMATSTTPKLEAQITSGYRHPKQSKTSWTENPASTRRALPPL